MVMFCSSMVFLVFVHVSCSVFAMFGGDGAATVDSSLPRDAGRSIGESLMTAESDCSSDRHRGWLDPLPSVSALPCRLRYARHVHVRLMFALLRIAPPLQCSALPPLHCSAVNVSSCELILDGWAGSQSSRGRHTLSYAILQRCVYYCA